MTDAAPSPTTEVCEERVTFHGQPGLREGVLAYPGDGEPTFSVLIVGPHPLLGGDLSNNVVTALRTRFAGAGAATLAFNYGGVGESEGGPADWPAVMSAFWRDGCFAEEADWITDTACAVAALRAWSDRPLVLVGYSFGCWTLSRILPQCAPRAVLLVSPNARQHTFDDLHACSAPLLVVHSDNDFTCTLDEITTWYAGVREPKTRVLLPAAQHFFRGQEAELAECLITFVHDQRQWEPSC
ncbi:MAG: alpha/beta hydrolase [Phycisphaerae bacterium]